MGVYSPAFLSPASEKGPPFASGMGPHSASATVDVAMMVAVGRTVKWVGDVAAGFSGCPDSIALALEIDRFASLTTEEQASLTTNDTAQVGSAAGFRTHCVGPADRAVQASPAGGLRPV